MQQYLISYVTTAVVFFGLDFLWLSTMHSRLYKPKLGGLLLDKPHLGVAGAFYALYVVGIVAFAVAPALAQGNWVRAVWGGALFGLIAYGTYDMTNLATLAGWSPIVTAADMLWGTFATTLAAVIGYFVVRQVL